MAPSSKNSIGPGGSLYAAIDQVIRQAQQNHPIMTYLTAATLIVAPIVYLFLPVIMASIRMRALRQLGVDHKNKIVLHVMERPVNNPALPSLSPFCVKLELYLRVIKADYVVCTKTGLSRKGKKPYITYNGREISDSELCIPWLEAHTGKKLNKILEPTELSAVEAYRTMIEDGLYWQNVYFRWCLPSSYPWIRSHLFAHLPAPMSHIIPLLVRPRIRRTLHHQGTSRHSAGEVMALADYRLQGLNDMLGDDDYFMGTHKPTTLDCSVFGLLAVWLFQDLPAFAGEGGRDEVGDMIRRRPKLVGFVKRVMASYFPERFECVDWDKVEEDIDDALDADYVEGEVKSKVKAEDEEEEEEDDPEEVTRWEYDSNADEEGLEEEPPLVDPDEEVDDDTNTA